MFLLLRRLSAAAVVVAEERVERSEEQERRQRRRAEREQCGAEQGFHPAHPAAARVQEKARAAGGKESARGGLRPPKEAECVKCAEKKQRNRAKR